MGTITGAAVRPRRVQTAAQATGITILLTLLSRVLGIVRDMVIAHQFGQNEVTTIYTAAFRVPDLIALVIAGGALSSVFVPVFTEYWSSKRESDAWRVFGTVMTIAGIAVAVLVGLMEIGVYPLTELLNRKFDPAQVHETAALTRILLPAQWCLIIGGLMNGTLYARKSFLIPQLSPVIYNLGSILGGLLLGRPDQLGIASMAWGTLIGAIVGSFVLPLIVLYLIGVKWQFSLNTQHPGVRKVGEMMVPILLGLSLMQLNMFITGIFLPADFRLSALRNAYNLTQAPIGIFAQAFAIVLLPTISAFAAEKNWKEFRRAISLGIRRVLFLTVPASLLMAVLAAPLIRLIYRHGAFTEESVHSAAIALLCYSLATFAWSATSILARGFYAMQDTRTPVLITTPMVFIFFGFCKIYSVFRPDGFIGYALATSALGIITMFFFLYWLQKKAGGLNMRGIVRSTARILFASLIASAAAWGATHFLEPHFGIGVLGSVVTLVDAGGIALLIYVAVSLFTRSPELWGVIEMFRRRKVKEPEKA